MKLTLSMGYGIGVLLQIQAFNGDGPVTAARIARDCHFPQRFLYRVLRRLVDAGLLKGISGPGGGYSLAKSLGEITLLDIARSVEGEPEPSALSPACPSQRKAIRFVNDLCSKNATRFAEDLDAVSLADLERLEPKRGARAKVRVK